MTNDKRQIEVRNPHKKMRFVIFLLSLVICHFFRCALGGPAVLQLWMILIFPPSFRVPWPATTALAPAETPWRISTCPDHSYPSNTLVLLAVSPLAMNT